jgi:hypothetical protein
MRTAFSALKAIWPVAAPGPAGSPRPRRRPPVSAFCFSFASNTGARSCVICPASTRSTASVLVINSSSTMSQAMRTAAKPVRLPVRVCSRYSLRDWIVNSMSCMSR